MAPPPGVQAEYGGCQPVMVLYWQVWGGRLPWGLRTDL